MEYKQLELDLSVKLDEINFKIPYSSDASNFKQTQAILFNLIFRRNLYDSNCHIGAGYDYIYLSNYEKIGKKLNIIKKIEYTHRDYTICNYDTYDKLNSYDLEGECVELKAHKFIRYGF